MNATQIVVRGTVKPDGTLEMKQPVDFPPGPVEIVLRPIPTPQVGGENWWQYLQRARAELEAMGHHFATGEEVNQHIEDLRSGDERIDEVYRQIEKDGRDEGER